LRRLEEALGRRYPPVTGSLPIASRNLRYVASIGDVHLVDAHNKMADIRQWQVRIA